ncbi:MAG: hypothetical protein H0X30_38920 [Anaerolineae bacterium]|nr:hypothetical protein [Anaerolineae bacterium]
MRNRFGRISLFVTMFLVLFSLHFPTLAQDDLTEKFSFDSGATFSYPKAWKLDKKSDPLKLVSDQTQLLVVDYAGLQAMGVDIKKASQNDILKAYFTNYYPDRSFKESKIEPLDIGKRSGVQYDYSADDGRARVIVIPFANGSAGVMEEISLAGKLREEDTVQAIVESFDNSDKISGTTTTVASQTVNCTISTSRDDTVHVRVGPGENRTSIIFLSAGSTYKVLGQAKAKDGSKWWKLDKSEVAPDKAANEVWVKQDDVKSIGDCDKVVDVNAPPVVPISNAPPSNNGSNSAPAGSPPSAGAWVIAYSNGKASCFGTGTVDVSVNLAPQAISLSVNGSVINLDGDILRHTGGNTYQGIGQLNVDGQNVSTNITVQVVSTTQIVGSLVYTANYGDTSCSVTYPFSVTKS